MRENRNELLRRFYFQLDLMCVTADGQTQSDRSLRLGNLYDDAAPTVWGSRSGGPFLFSLPS